MLTDFQDVPASTARALIFLIINNRNGDPRPTNESLQKGTGATNHTCSPHIVMHFILYSLALTSMRFLKALASWSGILGARLDNDASITGLKISDWNY